MKLSDIKGEKALEVLADILEPTAEIFSDPAVKEAFERKKKIDVAVAIIKEHPKAVLKIMALIEGEDPATYEPTIIDLPVKLIELMNDPAFNQFFPSQGQKMDKTSSGSATENTEAKEPE